MSKLGHGRVPFQLLTNQPIKTEIVSGSCPVLKIVYDLRLRINRFCVLISRVTSLDSLNTEDGGSTFLRNMTLQMR